MCFSSNIIRWYFRNARSIVENFERNSAFVDSIFSLSVVGITALGVLVFAGVRYISSAGNASAQEDAKKWIWDAILGLLLLLASFLILNTINPDLTELGVRDIDSILIDTPGSALYRACVTGSVAQYSPPNPSCSLGVGALTCAIQSCDCRLDAFDSLPLPCTTLDPDLNTLSVPTCGADEMCFIIKRSDSVSNRFNRVCCPAPSVSL